MYTIHFVKYLEGQPLEVIVKNGHKHSSCNEHLWLSKSVLKCKNLLKMFKFVTFQKETEHFPSFSNVCVDY